MDFLAILQALFALAVTLGLFGLAIVALRRYGPDALKKLQATQGPRRMKVIESVMLDPKSKLLLVDIDGAERLVLVGDARFAGEAEPVRRIAAPRKARS